MAFIDKPLASGSSVADHMSAVLAKMASTRPVDARKAFDVFSIDYKAAQAAQGEEGFERADPYDAAPASQERAEATNKWVDRVLAEERKLTGKRKRMQLSAR